MTSSILVPVAVVHRTQGHKADRNPEQQVTPFPRAPQKQRLGFYAVYYGLIARSLISCSVILGRRTAAPEYHGRFADKMK